jgi:glutaredoxin-related protein
MESCPDCVEVKQRYSNDPGFELVDIGKQARDLKEFLVLRDTHPAFVKVRERGNI